MTQIITNGSGSGGGGELSDFIADVSYDNWDGEEKGISGDKVYEKVSTMDNTLSTALQPGDNISQLNNNSGYITGIDSTDVTTALGYTPYNSSNPSGYVDKDVNNLTNYTKTTDLPDFTTYQTKGNLVTDLNNADNTHYPSSLAVKNSIAALGNGDVLGPSSSTDGHLAVFDGATGKLIKDGGAIPSYTAGTGLALTGSQFSADTTVLATKSDLANLGSFEVVSSLPSVSSANTKTIYLLGPTGTGADKYEEWIVQEHTGWISAGTLTSLPIQDFVRDQQAEGYEYIAQWSDAPEDLNTHYFAGVYTPTGVQNISGDMAASSASYDDTNGRVTWTNDGSYSWMGLRFVYDEEVSPTLTNVVYSSSSITWGTERVWTKIGETSIDLSGYAQKSEVLTKNNTTSFTPTGNYQPATKKYVDDSVTSATGNVINKGNNTGSEGSKLFSIVDSSGGIDLNSSYGPDELSLEVDYGTGNGKHEINLNVDKYSIPYVEVANSNGNVDDRVWLYPNSLSYQDVNYNYHTYSFSGDHRIATLDDTVRVGSTAPTSPTEGMLWYDTTNDVLKAYDGTNWNSVTPTVPTTVSSFTNDAGYLTSSTGVTSVNGSTGAVTVNDIMVSPLLPPTSESYGRVIYDSSVNKLVACDGNNWVYQTPFSPSNAGTTNQILTKTASGYNWQNAPASGIQPASSSPITVSNIWAGTTAQYNALSSYDNNTLYITTD